MKEEFNVEIDYRAFFLRPDLPVEGIPRPEKYNNPDSPVQRAAEEAGIKMTRPAIVPYTRLALEATESAKMMGVGELFHEATYKAYWEDGVDLGKIETLKKIAEDLGVDWNRMSKDIENRVYKDEVESQYEQALQVGVTGIPAYVIGKYFFTGAQPYEIFKQVAEKALAELEDPPEDAHEGHEGHDHEGHEE